MSTIAQAPPKARSHRTNPLQLTPGGVLAFIMFFTGGAGFVYQGILGAVFTNLLGNSMEQIILTMGFMMGMMGVAVWLQKLIRSGPLVEYFIIVELALAILGGFAPIILQWAFAHMPNDFGWIRLAYPALMALLIGIEIPLAMRINEKFARNLSSNLAETWAWDYVGSFVGTLAWLWALKHFVPIMHLSYWVAISNLIVAVASLVFFWKCGLLTRWASKIMLTLGMIMVATSLVVGSNNVDAWSNIISQKMYDDPIIYHTTTKYQDIVMTQKAHPTNRGAKAYEMFINGNKQFNSADERIYHEHLVHPAMNLAAAHRRVLILGGGDGLALREVLKYPDVEDVTLVDLDPGMIELARTNPIMRELNGNAFGDARVNSTLSPGLIDTGRTQEVFVAGDKFEMECTESGCYKRPIAEKAADVQVFTIDADRFVSVSHELFDVVIIDLPDPSSIELAKLYSQEFYQKVKQAMSTDGMLVVQATSPYHSRETFLCIMRTIAAAGFGTTPYHANIPSFGDWGWALGSPSLKPEVLRERAISLEDYGVPTEELTPESMRAALTFGKKSLTTNSQSISTLMEQAVLGHYIYDGWQGE